jgi:mRNA-degrading endonuclease RelE of RelBE toxin-antitoxin system
MISSENWVLFVDPKVAKVAKKFPKQDRERIGAAVSEMRLNPYTGDFSKLEGDNIWRRRTGSYRIFFEVDQIARTIIIFRIERRGSNTY